MRPARQLYGVICYSRELDAASQRVGERRTREAFLPGFTQDRLIGVDPHVERAAYRLETRVARFADHAQKTKGLSRPRS